MINIIIKNLVKPFYFIKYKFYVLFFQNMRAESLFKRYKTNRERLNMKNQKWEVIHTNNSLPSHPNFVFNSNSPKKENFKLRRVRSWSDVSVTSGSGSGSGSRVTRRFATRRHST